MPIQSWKQSTQALMRLVLEGHWEYLWRPNPRYWFPVTDVRLHRKVGVLDHQVLSTDGRSGYLLYGPYASVPAGQYRVRLFGQWHETGQASARLEVVAGQGQQTILHAVLAGDAAVSGCLLDKAFLLAADVAELELRLWFGASAQLSVTGIELLGQPPGIVSPAG